jgi:putative ABC transport system permease protein
MVPIRYNLRSLVVRKRTTIAAASGIALVVFVFASALMLSDGIKRTLGKSGHPDVAIVLRKGSQAELESTIEEEKAGTVLAAPGVKRTADGTGEGAAEVIVVAALEKLGGEPGAVSNVQIRGITENALKLRPEVKVVEGRPASLGADEAIIGARLRGRFKGLELGQSFDIKKNRPVKVVGIFEADGSSWESEVWTDIQVVRTSFRREGMFSSVRVRLESPSKFDGFKSAIEQDKQLGLEVRTEPDYFERQSVETSIFITALGVVIAVFFSMGAMIGAMITMYAAVSNRQREIGTLRALGFSRFAILTSFLIEAIALAVGGGLIGAFASLAMGFVKFSMMNFVSWSEIVFSFEPTPRIIISSLIFAGGMGLLGGFLPAIRAARMSPLQAIREA